VRLDVQAHVVDMSADGRRALAAADDGRLILWDLDRARVVLELPPPGGLPPQPRTARRRSLYLTGDERLAVHAATGGAAVHDLEAQCEPLIINYPGHDETILAATPSPDGRHLAAAGMYTVQMYDLRSGARLWEHQGHAWNVINFGPDGNAWITHPDGLDIRDLASGRVLASQPWWPHRISPGRECFLATSYSGFEVRDLERGQLRIPGGAAGHLGPVTGAAYRSDGAVLTCGASACLWDARRHRPTAVAEPDALACGSATSPGGRFLAGRGRRRLCIWGPDAGPAEPLHSVEVDEHVGSPLAVSAGGDLVVCADIEGGPLVLWRPGQGELAEPEADDPDDVIVGAAMCAGEDALVTAWGGTVSLRRLADGSLIRRVAQLDDNIHALCVLPGGDRTLAAGSAAVVHLVRLSDGEVLGQLSGHRRVREQGAGIHALACDASGERALSGGSDKALRLWDLQRGEAIATLKGHRAPVSAVAMDAAGLLAVSADETGRVLFWDLAQATAPGS